MRPPYEPRPGTVAFKLLAHMELLHKGSEITSSLLAAACGIDPNSVGPQLKPAVDAGLIFSRQKGGHPKSPRFWSLVDHSAGETKVQPTAATSAVPETDSPPAETDSPVVATDPPSPTIAKAMRAKVARAPSKTKAKPEAELSVREYIRAIERTVPPEPGFVKGEGDPEKLRVALWSDGTLEVRRSPDDLVLFTADEAREIVRYLVAVDA